MAASRVNYSSFKEYPGPIKRQGPFPIDLTAVFETEGDALAYAQSDPSAYDGQFLTVAELGVDSTNLRYFGIANKNGSATLIPLAFTSDLEAIQSQLAIYRQEEDDDA